jgi:hypothetical protein
MSRNRGTMQWIGALIRLLARRLGAAAELLVASLHASRDALPRPIAIPVDAARDRRNRIGARHRR